MIKHIINYLYLMVKDALPIRTQFGEPLTVKHSLTD